MIDIPLAEVSWAPRLRLMDINGRVFFWEGRVFRAIFPHRASFVSDLFSGGVVDDLVGDGLIVPTWPTDLHLEGFGAVIEHEKQDVETRSWEWPHSTLKQAGRVYLKLLDALDRHGLTLHDGHANNFSLAPGGYIRWHDFGSIVSQGPDRFPGLSEFMETLMFPLEIADEFGDMGVVRRLKIHVSRDDFLRLRGRPTDRRLLRAQGKGLGAVLERRLRLLEPDARGLQSIGVIARALAKRVTGRVSATGDERAQIRWLRKRLEQLEPPATPTLWSSYYEAGASVHSARMDQLENLLRESAPSRVLDVGANEGMFSALAARTADVVISTDSDEQATDKHAMRLRQGAERHRIYPLVHNFLGSTDEEAERMRSDVVLGLALTHHLSLGAGYPFEHIASLFDKVTERTLITEFMPNGLGGPNKTVPEPLPAGYTLEAFSSALEKRFARVEHIHHEDDPTRAPRTLVICRRAT